LLPLFDFHPRRAQNVISSTHALSIVAGCQHIHIVIRPSIRKPGDYSQEEPSIPDRIVQFSSCQRGSLHVRCLWATFPTVSGRCIPEIRLGKPASTDKHIGAGLTEEQIIELFSGAGRVLSFRLVNDRETGRPKGFGFAEYADYGTFSLAATSPSFEQLVPN
jgi:hypothetical protein